MFTPLCSQSLLEMAVKTSSAADDPLSDNLSFEMDPRSVVELARVSGIKCGVWTDGQERISEPTSGR